MTSRRPSKRQAANVAVPAGLGASVLRDGKKGPWGHRGCSCALSTWNAISTGCPPMPESVR